MELLHHVQAVDQRTVACKTEQALTQTEDQGHVVKQPQARDAQLSCQHTSVAMLMGGDRPST
jgi:hypothetical protein